MPIKYLAVFKWVAVAAFFSLAFYTYNSTQKELGAERELSRQLRDQVEIKTDLILQLMDREEHLQKQVVNLIQDRDNLRTIYEEDIATYKEEISGNPCGDDFHGDAVNRLLGE